jgi:hypothetical protein
VYRNISRDVKIAAIRLHERQLLNLNNILDCCGFSERTWYRILRLWRETGDVVPPSIHRELEWASVSKKLKRIAQKRNEMGRAVFIERMAQYSPEELGFLDEVSKDERSIGRHYGRARKGERAKKK